VKESKDDPRPPLAKRYADLKFYRQHLDEAAERLVDDRYMLAEDRERYGKYGTALWDFVAGKK
jgi:hypothetical protein